MCSALTEAAQGYLTSRRRLLLIVHVGHWPSPISDKLTQFSLIETDMDWIPSWWTVNTHADAGISPASLFDSFPVSLWLSGTAFCSLLPSLETHLCPFSFIVQTEFTVLFPHNWQTIPANKRHTSHLTHTGAYGTALGHRTLADGLKRPVSEPNRNIWDIFTLIKC